MPRATSPDRALSPGRPPGFVRQTLVILRKDLLIELMSGEVVTTSAFFGLLVVIISSFSFYGGPASKRLVAAGTLWLSEESALAGLLVAPVSRAAIFAGKSLGLMAFLAVVEAVVIPLTALLFSIDLVAVGPALVVICLLSTPGLAATGTLFGSMTVRTRARDLLLAIVLLPLLSPTLLASVAATRELFGGVPLAELGDYLKLMALFDVIFVTGGLALFGTLIES